MRTALFAILAVLIASAVRAGPMQESLPTSFNWGGLYIGANAGAFEGDTQFDRTTGFLANNTTSLGLGLRPTEYAVRDSGFIGGGQVGYNFDPGVFRAPFGADLGRIVLGIELDAAFTDFDQTDTLANTTMFGALNMPSPTPVTRVNQYASELKYLGTARGRLGLAFGQTLFYGTGGFAYGDVRRQVTFNGPNTPTAFFQGSDHGIRTGYAYGGGVEVAVPLHMFSDPLDVLDSAAVTLKAEYLHYDLGSDTLRVPGINGGATIGGYMSRVRTGGDIVRAGINYKF